MLKIKYRLICLFCLCFLLFTSCLNSYTLQEGRYNYISSNNNTEILGITNDSYFFLDVFENMNNIENYKIRGKWVIFEGSANVLLFSWYNCEFEKMPYFEQIGMAGDEYVLSSNEIENSIIYISIKNSSHIEISYTNQSNSFCYRYSFTLEK